MEIINIPTKPDDFLGLPIHSHVSLFYEKNAPPYNTYESKKHRFIIFKIANIQLTYTRDFLQYIMIDFGFRDKFIFKFNSIEINGNTSYDDIKHIIVAGKMEYIENWFSEDQLNIAINNWVVFIFHNGKAGILLDKINFPFSRDIHQSLLRNDQPKKVKGGSFE
ncbi:hypothetical protein [Emticicia sp. C21]|uniref:hypothetical protein n=1 Tax=Emticicia sp. C21 TaxID=2302915 RepID=UPI000E34DE50|nr:hypothetical protein [Emticicia sp. C21]RFS16902.1 hypothetical protein D0T08_09500 [Emticicia sp. C21]